MGQGQSMIQRLLYTKTVRYAQPLKKAAVATLESAGQHKTTAAAAAAAASRPRNFYRTSPLVWIDVESTGLVTDKDIILEVAMIITNDELEQLGPEQSIVIQRTPKELSSKLNPWSLKFHGGSGLLDEVKASTVTLDQAEKMLMSQIVTYCPKPGRALLAGNNVGFDRAMLNKEMPVLANYLHFRNLDVSTVNEMAKRWNPAMLQSHKKKFSHRAIDDIRESIRELKHYKRMFLVHDNGNADNAEK
ncbi:hypothetical protein GGI07_005665 [Coemansia sp. Benny D115]|nr:hypothetical protein GGI07_005665 [Coemansia sp. Benny D115]